MLGITVPLNPFLQQQVADRQKKPSFQTLRFPLSVEFWRHGLLNSGTQCVLPRHQRKYEIFHFLEWESNTQPHVAFTFTRLWPCITTSTLCKSNKADMYLIKYSNREKISILSVFPYICVNLQTNRTSRFICKKAAFCTAF